MDKLDATLPKRIRTRPRAKVPIFFAKEDCKRGLVLSNYGDN